MRRTEDMSMIESTPETPTNAVEAARPPRPGAEPSITGVPARRVWRPPFVSWRTPEDVYDHPRPAPMDEMP